MNLISFFDKKACYALSIIFTFFFKSGISQEGLNVSFIQRLEVSYIEPDLPLIDSVKMVRMQSEIIFKNGTNVKKINLKILARKDNQIVYQASYDVSSTVIKNTNGIEIFRNENNICYINSSIDIPFNAYEFQLTTVDNEGNLSEIYSEIK